MFVPFEYIAISLTILLCGLTWYLGYCRGVKVGAEGMFDSLVEDDYLQVRTDADGEVHLIEPEWKQQNNR
jgi:hypothetical protein